MTSEPGDPRTAIHSQSSLASKFASTFLTLLETLNHLLTDLLMKRLQNGVILLAKSTGVDDAPSHLAKIRLAVGGTSRLCLPRKTTLVIVGSIGVGLVNGINCLVVIFGLDNRSALLGLVTPFHDFGGRIGTLLENLGVFQVVLGLVVEAEAAVEETGLGFLVFWHGVYRFQC